MTRTSSTAIGSRRPWPVIALGALAALLPGACTAGAPVTSQPAESSQSAQSSQSAESSQSASAAPDSRVPRASPAPAVPATHRVTISVRGNGASFRVRGEVFGDTGLIDMPPQGRDAASFDTAEPGNRLDLQVEVLPGDEGTGMCSIAVDGVTMAHAQIAGPGTPTALCTLRGA